MRVKNQPFTMLQNVQEVEDIIKGCAMIIILSSLLTLLGWIYNVPILKSIAPIFPATKVITALMFLGIGLTLFILLKAKHAPKARILVGISGGILLILTILMTITFITGTSFGLESVGVAERADEAVKTIIPGLPSAGTLLALALISIIFMMKSTGSKRRRTSIMSLCTGGICIAVVAFLGYTFNIPVLYYYIENVNTGMSILTASLTLLTNGALLLNEESLR